MSDMRKLVALVTVALALAAFGCAPAKKEFSGKSLIKCTTCGVEFTVDEGMSAYEAAHGH
jgi:hypothetical protein